MMAGCQHAANTLLSRNQRPRSAQPSPQAGPRPRAVEPARSALQSANPAQHSAQPSPAAGQPWPAALPRRPARGAPALAERHKQKCRMTDSNSGEPRELFVLIHGLLGGPSDMAFVAQQIEAAMPSATCFRVSCNRGWLDTLDGVDAGGLRVAEAVEKRLKHGNFTSISLVGYSLGGLYARYCARILRDRGVFERVRPHFFITIGSPHLGSRDFAWPTRKAIGLGLWRTGAQLVLEDDPEEPLLVRMCTEPFLAALRCFHKRIAVGHAHDGKVGFKAATLRSADEPHLPVTQIKTLPLAEELAKSMAAANAPPPCEERKWAPAETLARAGVPAMVTLKLANWFGIEDVEERMVRSLRSLVWERLDVTNFSLVPQFSHSDLVARLPWNVACKDEIKRLSNWLAANAAAPLVVE
eukprot:m.155438 g.155438  ORF g.155438 m.155438 type:complete len:412 (+) comp10204_c0_seq2:438-1673(+)